MPISVYKPINDITAARNQANRYVSKYKLAKFSAERPGVEISLRTRQVGERKERYKITDYELTNLRTDGRTDGPTDKSTKGRTDGPTDRKEVRKKGSWGLKVRKNVREINPIDAGRECGEFASLLV